MLRVISSGDAHDPLIFVEVALISGLDPVARFHPSRVNENVERFAINNEVAASKSVRTVAQTITEPSPNH